MVGKVFVSVIIPCYNSGEFLPDAITSVYQRSTEYTYDIIIVDDGSTDKNTLNLLEDLKKQNITVIHQENKGPAAARNTGVRASEAKYLLFLDSDNKIRPTYISKAVGVMESDPEIGIVYGAPNFFGDSTEARFTPREFNIYTIHKGNSIDMCAVVRREVWDSVGGFDEERLLIGHEDWDFWIMAGAKGWKFHYIKEVLFDYRIRQNSVIVNANHGDKVKKVVDYFHVKHKDLLLYNYEQLYRKKLFYEEEHKNPWRLFIKYLYRTYFMKLLSPFLKAK
ncbi:glycosyltransferase family 2 protein [Pontibacter pudoricolor]|uniref:glycosyltransferase family 2 protein n=1 Tax=Pontibacter pudoricolor TaxID=2694930 RepID=UPI00139151BD|nr:glycosyltransferase family A protein [Pontibacter pudoricolor]